MRWGVVMDGVVDFVAPLDEAAVVNLAPTPRLTPDREFEVGTVIRIFAATSSDPEGTELTYAWALLSQPVGSNVTLGEGLAASDKFLGAEVLGEYRVSVGVSDGVNPIVWHTGRTYTAVPPPVADPDTVPAGDWDTAGADPRWRNDPAILWVGTGSRTGEPNATVDGYSVPGGWKEWSPAREVVAGLVGEPRLRSVTGKSWSTEIVTYNPGLSDFWGHEWRLYLPDIGDISGALDEAYIGYGYRMPVGQNNIGDMKVPGLGGCDFTTPGRPSDAFNETGWVTYDGFNFGLMTSNWLADTTKYDMTVYFSAYQQGGVSRRYPAAKRATPIYTAPGSGERLLLDKGTDYDIVVGGSLNTLGNEDGVYSVWITPAGASERILRFRESNIEFRTRAATHVNFFQFRSFYGGPDAEQPKSPTTDATAPHFRDFCIATTESAIPIVRAT